MPTIINPEDHSRKTKVLRGTKTSELKKMRDDILKADLPPLPKEKMDEPLVEKHVPRGKIIAID